MYLGLECKQYPIMNLPKSEVGSHAFRARFANDFEEYYLDRPENKATTKAQTTA